MGKVKERYYANIEAQVTSYINGNISQTRAWLKRANKIKMLDFYEELCAQQGHSDIDTLRRLL